MNKTVIFFPCCVAFIFIVTIQKMSYRCDVVGRVSDTIEVCGEVDSARLDDKTGVTTLLLKSGSYNQIIKIIIPAETRAAFDFPLERLFLGRDVCVNGKVIENRSQLELFVYSKSQIKLVLADNTIQSMH